MSKDTRVGACGLKVAFCFNMRKLTQEEFVYRAKEVHGEKYDYSKVEYKKAKEKICIVCHEHGEFWQIADHHLRGRGCPKCGSSNMRTIVYGCGVLDKEDGTPRTYAEKIWRDMIMRCHWEKARNKYPTYANCSVCEDWLFYSNFEKWYKEHYVEGWQLDKDILVKGNKVYSPQTCCFVPQEINKLLNKNLKQRGINPIGVSYVQSKGKYVAYAIKRTVGAFNTPEEAFYAYKEAKEARIREVADKWRDQLDPRVYEAMYNYKVEITD